MSPSASKGDGRLWAIALGLSMLLNFSLLLVGGLISLNSAVFHKSIPDRPATAEITSVLIFPEIITPTATPAEATQASAPAKPRFARTSEDQTATPPEKAAFIGERDTQATSDQPPSATAPQMPSESGEKPKNPDHFETTESDYRDGKLSERITPPSDLTTLRPAEMKSSDPTAVTQSNVGEKVSDLGNDETTSTPPTPTRLLEGPNPVDVPVPRESKDSAAIKPTPALRQKDGSSASEVTEMPKPSTPKPNNDPAFSGNQRKTAIVGSISRTGRSALNVADSALGRYQAAISRAVEQEWQRNCVRHRDFITPGYLTVRFFVDPNGKVRTVRFVGQMETGEVQKGFTLNSIRNAEIPAMPTAVKKELEMEPLELIFNFYF